MKLLEVKNIKKYFPIKKGFFKRTVAFCKAVDGVSFFIESGETFGLVGESGCGKTTIGKSILRLIEPTEGTVFLNGKDLCEMSKENLRKQRKNIQIIFQDPYSSLNPRMTIGDIIGEPLKEHKLVQPKDCKERVVEIMETVGINHAEFKKYPHEFSGGQRQRIAIARALSVEPKLIVCDEPVSALDVSVQAQILNLMKKLQNEMGIAYLFIAHGMPVVQHVSRRIGVMYLGKLVEIADSKDIFTGCMHPYTKALISAIPIPDPTVDSERIILQGEVPDLMSPPSGCMFYSRCCHRIKKCRDEVPELNQVSENHFVACHLIK